MYTDKVLQEFYRDLLDYMHHEVHSRTRALAMLLQLKKGIPVECSVASWYMQYWLEWDYDKQEFVRGVIGVEKEVKKELMFFIKQKLLVGDRRQRMLLKPSLIDDFCKIIDENPYSWGLFIKPLSRHTKDRFIVKHIEESIEAIKALYTEFTGREKDVDEIINKKENKLLVCSPDKELKAYGHLKDYLLEREKKDAIIDALLEFINDFGGTDYKSLAEAWLKDYMYYQGTKDMTVGAFRRWLKKRYRVEEVDIMIEELRLLEKLNANSED